MINLKKSDKILIDKKTHRLFQELLKLVAPRPIMTISEWAEEHRFLSSEASAEPGKYRTDRAPYQKGMMDAVSDTDVESVVFMTSAQIGKTEILLNILGYYMDYEPSPILFVLPTKELAEPFSKDRLAPMIRDTATLRDKVKDVKSRNSNNTILHKKFPGGQINIVGANSPSSLASRPIKIILCDELDRFPVSAGTEGDPFELAKKRTTTFRNRKIIAVSTPTTKGISRIEKEYESSTMEQWCVPCPNCNHMQPLEWSRILFPDKKYIKPTMKCVFCDERFEETEWKEQFKNAKWIARKESNKRGFHINELSSTWKTWEEIINDFKEAWKYGEDVFKVWINTCLGESWEEKGDSVDDTSLNARREVYGAEIPKGALILTAGVDVQDNRFEVEVVGWGRDYESYGIEYTKIFGDPAKSEIWNKLEIYLDKTFSFLDGTKLNIAITCVDSGGHFTTEVYKFCKKVKQRKIYPIKGKGGQGLPFIHSVSKNNSEKVSLFILGVDSGKESLVSRLKTTEHGAGFCHFPKEVDRGYDLVYFKGLTSEYKTAKKVNGVPKLVWLVKTGCRNEPFDIRNYATAGLEIISPINFTALENQIAKGVNYMSKKKATKKSNGVLNKGIEI